MSEMQSNRRQQAQHDLGLDNEREQAQMERAMQKEEERRQRKEEKRLQIETSLSYRSTKTIAKWMDTYCLDPLLGFFLPGLGDFLTSVLVLPFIYVSVFHIRSFPLTLAIIFNVLRDIALGLIPFWICDIIDIFNRGYRQNCNLIIGFVEDDKEVIDKVNRKAIWMAILIVIFCLIIYWLVKLAIDIATGIGDLISNLFS